MKIAEAYKWEAEKQNGEIFTTGGDLAECIRFSLLPQIAELPSHDLIGIPMIRRFGRGMIRQAMCNFAMLPGFLRWEHDSDIVWTEENLTEIVRQGSLIKKRHDGEEWWLVLDAKPDQLKLYKPYTGKTKRIESKVYLEPPKPEYLHCIVCEGFRIYYRSTDGSSLITPQDYELYI